MNETSPASIITRPAGVVKGPELKPEPKHPFVTIIVINSDGAPINTFGGENAPLASILRTAADLPGGRVTKTTPLMPLSQDIYLVSRFFAQAYVWTFNDKSDRDIGEMVGNMPETAKYYFSVVY